MKLRFIFIAFIVFVCVSCRKNNSNPVPSIPFDMTIDINLPSYSALIGVGGWTYVAGGSKGIIVYRRAIDEFVAFDRHSPADPEGICSKALTPDTSNFLQLNDSCSGAKFSLYDGSPMSGSDYGLRQYQTVYNGSNLLRIYN
jgi:hypothetical protein